MRYQWGYLYYDDIFALGRDANGDIHGVRVTNEVLAVDAQSGAATFVTILNPPFTIGNVWGGSISPDPAPEPASVVLLGVGVPLAMRRIRRDR